MANMPKRRKSKDNPYKLDYNEMEHIYTVSFKDNKQKTHNVEVSKTIFEAFNEFELQDISELHKKDKHIDGRRIDGADEHSEIILYHKAITSIKPIDEEVEEKLLIQDLRKAINQLSDIHKRRIIKYFFDNKTYEEIAKEENCSKVAVKYSLDIAIKKLKEILKK